jgi:hypothetical protein
MSIHHVGEGVKRNVVNNSNSEFNITRLKRDPWNQFGVLVAGKKTGPPSSAPHAGDGIMPRLLSRHREDQRKGGWRRGMPGRTTLEFPAGADLRSRAAEADSTGK